MALIIRQLKEKVRGMENNGLRFVLGLLMDSSVKLHLADPFLKRRDIISVNTLFYFIFLMEN